MPATRACGSPVRIMSAEARPPSSSPRRIHHNRFAAAGFPGQQVQPRVKTDAQTLHHGVVLHHQQQQHSIVIIAARSRRGHCRPFPTAYAVGYASYAFSEPGPITCCSISGISNTALQAALGVRHWPVGSGLPAASRTDES